jgi:chorismate dehydratase
VIGDRALKIRDAFTFKYDLGSGWKDMTGLPFVFAVWVAKKQINGKFIGLFNKDLGLGLSKINSIIKHNDESNYPMDMYFRKNISYLLSENMMDSMKLFLSFLKNS